MGKPNKRGYDEVLRLVDTFDMDIVQRAIGQAIEACEKAGITLIRSARILSAPQLQRRRGSRG
jgi:N-methylhydantoinase B/oxoprolinase/acetone carboxylase alpha subunit